MLHLKRTVINFSVYIIRAKWQLVIIQWPTKIWLSVKIPTVYSNAQNIFKDIIIIIKTNLSKFLLVHLVMHLSTVQPLKKCLCKNFFLHLQASNFWLLLKTMHLNVMKIKHWYELCTQCLGFWDNKYSCPAQNSSNKLHSPLRSSQKVLKRNMPLPPGGRGRGVGWGEG